MSRTESNVANDFPIKVYRLILYLYISVIYLFLFICLFVDE